jgi:hypothetical protein
LESSLGALSDGTIRFLIQPFSGKMHFLKKSLKVTTDKNTSFFHKGNPEGIVFDQPVPCDKT